MTTPNYTVESIGAVALFASGAWFYGSKVFFHPYITRFLELVGTEVGIVYDQRKYYDRNFVSQKLNLGPWMLYIAWALTYLMPVVNFIIDTAGMLGFFFLAYGYAQADPLVALDHWYFFWWSVGLLFGGSLMVHRHYGYLYTPDQIARTWAVVLMLAGGLAILVSTAFVGVLAYNSGDFNFNNNWITASFWLLILYSVCMILTFLWAIVLYYWTFDANDFMSSIAAHDRWVQLNKMSNPNTLPPPMPQGSRVPGYAPQYNAQAFSRPQQYNYRTPVQQPQYWAKPHSG